MSNDQVIFSNLPSKKEESEVAVLDRQKVKEPKMYKVLMHNDDYTTMEFVVHVLQKFFNKNAQEATAIMLKIHTDGAGVAGIFTQEVAETKSVKVVQYARTKGHPLKTTIEPCE